jgi:hypothetical protein
MRLALMSHQPQQYPHEDDDEDGDEDDPGDAFHVGSFYCLRKLATAPMASAVDEVVDEVRGGVRRR